MLSEVVSAFCIALGKIADNGKKLFIIEKGGKIIILKK